MTNDNTRVKLQNRIPELIINKAVIYNDEFSRKQLNKKAIKLLEEIKGNQNEN